jgi:hypothetical protein
MAAPTIPGRKPMKKMILRSALTAFACAGAFALTTPSMAETINLKAELSSKTEVPPNDSKATGTVAATFDDASKKLTWKGSYKDLTGPATMAHFHGPAAEGKNAGVAVPIAPNGPEFEGSATLTDAQAKEMLAGDWYVNVHTAANKGGEIRGQLKK